MNHRKIAVFAGAFSIFAATSPVYGLESAEQRQLEEAFQLLGQVYASVGEVKYTMGSYPSSFAEAGLPAVISGQYVQSVLLDSQQPGGLVTTFKTSGSVSSLSGKYFKMTPVQYAIGIGWECGESNIRSPYLTEYCQGTPQTQISELFMILGAVKSSVSEFFLSEGEFPTSNKQAGLSDDMSARFAASVVVSPDGSGTLIATLKLKGVSPEIAGKQLLFKPNINNGYLAGWKCGYSTIPPEYLTNYCGN